MNHSASGSSASEAAPSGMFFDRTARSTPSAPTPKCRSQIAAICAGVRSISPSGSANSTKSLPVPWPLVNCSEIVIPSIMAHGITPHGREGLRDTVRVAGLDPSRLLVALEPAHLAPGVATGQCRGLRDRLLLGEPSRELTQGLGVT